MESPYAEDWTTYQPDHGWGYDGPSLSSTDRPGHAHDWIVHERIDVDPTPEPMTAVPAPSSLAAGLVLMVALLARRPRR